jgi:hypothetical protein
VIENTLSGKFRLDIFATWLPWIYEFTKEDGFEPMWQSRLFLHYSSDCNTIMNEAIQNNNKKGFVTSIKKEYKKLKHMDVNTWLNI